MSAHDRQTVLGPMNRFIRRLSLSGDGAHLLVANQHSDTVVVMRIDSHTGVPTEVVSVTQGPTPMCLKFAPLAMSGPD